MTMLKEVLVEIGGMFVGDARLSMAVLAIVALAAFLVKVVSVSSLIGGAALFLGCLALLVENVLRSSRRNRK